MRTTYMANDQTVERKWFVIDAEGERLGRLASEVATLLRGKHKPTYTPHVDTGDHVIIVNADKIELTGNKLSDKKYYNHSGYTGGMRERSAGELLATRPEQLIETAVRGMLPKGALG